MNLINHDIEHEKRLIEILGYSLIDSDNSNCWKIIDENNKQVGFIQYEKIFNKNKKLGYPASFAYHMLIDSREVSYNSKRRITNKEGNQINDNKFSYELNIKRENGNIDHLVINTSKYPCLQLWSNDYGYMRFRLDFEGLYLNYRSKTNNFNVEETLVFKSEEKNEHNHPKEYAYVISYCDKKIDISDENAKGIKTREISGVSTMDDHVSNSIKVSEKSWINHKIRINRENIVSGTVEDMLVKHGVGIESFNHFRYLINKILPFKEEVISSLLKESGGNKNVMSIFLPDLEEAEINKGIQKVKNNYKRK